MKTKNIILVQQVLSNRSNAMVWAVYVQSEEQEQFKNFCKSAYSAMKYAFLIKAQHGLQISENCLTRLSHQIAMEKRAKAEKLQQVAVELAEKYSVNNVLQIADKAKKQTRKKSKVAKSTKLGLKDIDKAIEKMQVAAS